MHTCTVKALTCELSEHLGNLGQFACTIRMTITIMITMTTTRQQGNLVNFGQLTAMGQHGKHSMITAQ